MNFYSHKFGLHAFALTLARKSFTHYQTSTAAKNQIKLTFYAKELTNK